MRKLICVLAIAGSATALQAQVNGGFETGDTTGWTVGGDLSFTAVTGTLPHTGAFSYQAGPTGGIGFLEQAIPCNVGDLATVDFWLAGDNFAPNSFAAYFDGALLTTQVDTGFGYTQFTFANIPVTTANPVIHFEFSHPPAYWYLDDVSVTCIPAPGAAALIGLGGLFAARRRRSN